MKWKFFFLVNGVLVLFLGVALGREFFHAREIQKQIDQLESQAQSLANKNIALSELQTAIQTQSFIEREARLKLGMKKPGEQVVIVQDDARTSTVSTKTQANPSDPLGLVDESGTSPRIQNSTKWWYYFFRKSDFNILVSYEN